MQHEEILKQLKSSANHQERSHRREKLRQESRELGIATDRKEKLRP